MGSSDVIDSGRFAGGQRSNFNQTCSLLSQYLKQKGSFGDITLGVNRNLESNGTPTKTMNLLPMIEKAGRIPKVKPEPEKAQMTIFYAGQVIVFNDFPADKAEEIMLLASRGSPLNPKAFTPSASVVPNQLVESAAPSMLPPAASVVPNFGINMVQENHSQRTLSTKINDLPIARKNSLTRFLEKRKDRITTKAPYQMNNKGVPTPKKPDADSKTWLGLAAASSAQFLPLQMDRKT